MSVSLSSCNFRGTSLWLRVVLQIPALSPLLSPCKALNPGWNTVSEILWRGPHLLGLFPQHNSGPLQPEPPALLRGTSGCFLLLEIMGAGQVGLFPDSGVKVAKH